MAKAPNSRRNLDRAIVRNFGDKQFRIRAIIANTIIGQFLPAGAVKGGSSLKLRYGDKETRFTSDLDAARAEELDVYINELFPRKATSDGNRSMGLSPRTAFIGSSQDRV